MTEDSSTQYVSRTEQGGWRITGTRVSLESIVHAWLDGHDAEVIVESFPSLSLEQIHGAIAFYLRHRDEIDEYLAEQSQTWDRFRRTSETNHRPLLQRVRAARSASSPRGHTE